MVLAAAERARLEIELAVTKSRLEKLNKLVLRYAMGEIRRGLRLDIQKQTKLMAEIKRKLAEA